MGSASLGPPETRSLVAGYLRVSWTLSGLDPAEIHLQGVLDFVGCEALDRVVAGVLLKQYRRILIDLSQLDRMTAAGADGLLKAATAIRQRSGRVALVGPTQNVRTLIESVGLDRQIDVYDTEEVAVRGIESER